MTEIDALIEKHTKHCAWSECDGGPERIAGSGGRVSGYPETPHAIVINEALEIARKFFFAGVGAVYQRSAR